jgi:hypothetical protein
MNERKMYANEKVKKVKAKAYGMYETQVQRIHEELHTQMNK